MTDWLLAFAVFGCGMSIGFIAAAFFAVGRHAEERDFDGGFSQEHPPVRTVIWSKHIQQKDE